MRALALLGVLATALVLAVTASAPAAGTLPVATTGAAASITGSSAVVPYWKR